MGVFHKIFQLFDDANYELGNILFTNATEKENVEESKLIERDIHKEIDEHYHIYGKGYDVDLIFGKEKVFFIGRFNLRMRASIIKILEEHDTQFVPPKKV